MALPGARRAPAASSARHHCCNATHFQNKHRTCHFSASIASNVSPRFLLALSVGIVRRSLAGWSPRCSGLEMLSVAANRLHFVLKSTPPHLNRLCAMSNSSDSKSKKLLDVPAFLRDPQPSKPMKCPTLLVAWLNQPKVGAGGERPQDAMPEGEDRPD